MGNRHVPIQAQIALAILIAGAPRAALFGAGQGAMPDVLIEAEEKRPVSREKPPFNPEVKEDSPLEADLQVEDDVRMRVPAEVAQSTAFIPSASASAQAAAPSSLAIHLAWGAEPARVFFPLKELESIYPKQSREDRSQGRWEYMVIDSAGRVFRRFGGQGLPPERLEFDGKSDEGKLIKVGHAYTGLLTYNDAGGRAHTSMGRAFALAGLGVKTANGAVISLASRALFDPRSAGARLSSQGKALLREAAQLIQRHHPGLGIEVAARLSRPDAAWVQDAAQLCAKDLSKRLLIASGLVGAKGYPSTADLDERVDVLVANR